MLKAWIRRFQRSFSAVGLLLGTLFFAASLTPSLLPRNFITQGALSGVSLAAGYGVGIFGYWLWTYLELPRPGARTQRIVKLAAIFVFTIMAIAFLWRAADWQNTIRELMQMDPVDTAHPFRVGLIALVVFVALIAVARLFRLTVRFASARLDRIVPRRISNVIGIVIAVALFGLAIDGVIFRFALRAADASFKAFDALQEVGIDKPSDPGKTGSTASLVGWRSLGRAGREFISSGPSRENLQAFSGQEALEPLRVYVGLRSADTAQGRAKIAVDELKRVGAFERSVLIIATPTGTGWLDPEAMDTVEYLHAGDVASVAMQYSYLTSWLSLLVEPGYGADAARALFKEVYGYWTSLPKGDRPKLYLHGLSLGALSSELSTELFEILADPIHGALWSGPPFSSKI